MGSGASVHTRCMRFFSRSAAVATASANTAASAVVDTRNRRKPPHACASCRLNREPLYYLENGRDYCRPCAVRCWEQMRLQPAGRRVGDITLQQLLA